MICSTCKAPYDGLGCPVCLARRSREASLQQQRIYLPSVLDGAMRLRVARRRRSDPYHVELFNEHTHTYCGERLDGLPLRDRIHYSDGARLALCGKCLEVFDGLARKEAVA